MGYSTSSPPVLLFQPVGGNSRRVWLYESADTAATVDTSGYFTNGYTLGMRDGDLLFVLVTGTKVWTCHTVLNTSGTTIDIADGTTVGTSTNTD